MRRCRGGGREIWIASHVLPLRAHDHRAYEGDRARQHERDDDQMHGDRREGDPIQSTIAVVHLR